MSRTTKDESLWEIVRSHRRAILVTILPNGLPHPTNVHYLADPKERIVRVTTTTTRVKGRNLLRDPRAVLHVQGDDWFTFTVAEGRVQCALPEAPGDPTCDDLHAIFSAFGSARERPAFDEQMLAKHRMMVHLSVDRLYGQIPPREVVAARARG